MSVERALYALLTGDAGVSALIGARLYPVIAPLGTAAPYATYQRISARRVRSLTQRSGLSFARIQVDALATTYAGARGLADAIRTTLDGYRGTAGGIAIESATLQSDQDIYEGEAEPPLYRVSQDYMLAHTEE